MATRQAGDTSCYTKGVAVKGHVLTSDDRKGPGSAPRYLQLSISFWQKL